MGVLIFTELINGMKDHMLKGVFINLFFSLESRFFDFFELTKAAYKLKNLLSGLPEDKFLGNKPPDGCTSSNLHFSSIHQVKVD